MEIYKDLNNTSLRKSAANSIAEGVVVANMETAKLLTVFPNEIWLQILERVSDPQDPQNLHQSSPFFKNFLKTKALFPQVIKILAAKPNSAPKDILWKILLEYRFVCRTWEHGVESVLQNLFEYEKLVDRPDIKNVPNMACTRLESIYDIETFLQDFDAKYATANRNPFFCKSVCLNYMLGCMTIQVVTPQALKIFRLYGHNISRFSVAYGNSFSRTPETLSYVWWLFELLPRFLNLMPNLKVLELDCPLEWNISKHELEDLELRMQSCAVPALNNLRHLSVQNFPAPIFDALLRNYSNVTMLSLSPITTSSVSFYVQPMPNLTQLELVMRNSLSLILLEMASVRWPLKTLFLRIETALFDWETLFRTLENRWAATLNELKIDADFFRNHTLQV